MNEQKYIFPIEILSELTQVNVLEALHKVFTELGYDIEHAYGGNKAVIILNKKENVQQKNNQ